MPESESKPDPRALTSEYHKARKQLMLWAGILFIWELVGVDLGKAEATGGNVGAIITAIKSPQAIPWVLVVLVAYFLFKCTIEWYQCTENRRKLPASRIDFISAWFFSLSAFVLYFGQAISRVQIADLIQNSARARSFTTGLLIGGLLSGEWMFVRLLRKIRPQIERWNNLIFAFNGLVLAVVTYGLFGRPQSLPIKWLNLIGGLVIMPLLFALWAYAEDRQVQTRRKARRS